MGSGVSTLLGQARTTLIDADSDTWTDTELLGYLVMGVNKCCALLLDPYITVVDHELSSGMRQYLPEDGLLLIDPTTNGDGAPVMQQALTELARTQPTWANATPGQPSYVIYDRRSPKTFMVWPPAGSGASVELVIGAMPPAFGLSDVIPIDQWFDSALWAFVCGMALAKNTARQDLGKSQQFMAMYTADLERWDKAKSNTIATADRQGAH